MQRVYDGFCPHHHAAINEGMRTLRCKACEAHLDPFDFLLRLSRDTDRWITSRQDAERRAAAAHQRLENVLRLERNARNRLKRLTNKETP